MSALRLRRLALAVLISLTFVACSGGDDETAAGETPSRSDEAPTDGDSDSDSDASGLDACGLVTQDDAERILGEAVEVAEPRGPEGVVSAECVWSNLAADHGAFLQFRVFAGAQFFQPDAFSGEAGFEAIDGVGDDAFLVIADNTVTLNVLVGDQMVQLDASQGGGGFDAETFRAAVLDLAERVLAAL